jgi:hypothetical protein
MGTVFGVCNMKRKFTTIVAAAILLLASCGGQTQLAGIQGSGSPVVASGAITGFGSIFVNGVEYATSNAQIRIDDQPGAESQLLVGQVVTVTGSVNSDGTTGTATQVTFSGEVAGPITGIDTTGGTFVVLGQTVRAPGSTLFDNNIQPASIASLQVGNIVEVSGFPNAAGEIVASRIQLEAAGSALEVKGTVQSLDMTTHTFRVNTLTVDYSAITPSGSLANGVTVKVSGTLLNAAGALVATRVDVLQGFGGTANAEGEIEGLITTFTSTADFVISGQRVTTNATTQFMLDGVTLAVDVRVEVEGSFDASGVLVATSVQATPDSSSLVRGLVDNVNAGSNTLTVLGVTITTSSDTEFEDDSSQQMRPFNLSDVHTNDYVEARGAPAQTGGLNASILVRDSPENHSYLQGTASNVASPNLTVLGIMVVTNPLTTQFSGPDGGTLSAAAFFSQAPNQTVKVRGTVSAGVFTADQAQIEP